MARARKQAKADPTANGAESESAAAEGESSVNLTDVQQVDVKIEPKNRVGKPAPIDGTPVWASSDETVCTVTPNADDRSAVVKATGAAGEARVTVTADADLGEGIQPIVGVLTVTVTQEQAVTVDLTVSEPADQQ